MATAQVQTKPAAKPKAAQPKPTESAGIDQKIERFDRLHGLANKRERLASTLSRLKSFQNHHDDQAFFQIEDGKGEQFQSRNSELVDILVKHLESVLSARKEEVEKELLEFKF